MASTVEKYDIVDNASFRSAVATLRRRCVVERKCHHIQGKRFERTENGFKTGTFSMGVVFMILFAPRIFMETPKVFEDFDKHVLVCILALVVVPPMLRDILQIGERKFYHVSEFNKYNFVLDHLTALEQRLNARKDDTNAFELLMDELVRCEHDANWNRLCYHREIPESVCKRVVADFEKQK